MEKLKRKPGGFHYLSIRRKIIMADLFCRKCGGEIQESDEACSKCGEKVIKKAPGISKQVLVVGILLALIITFVAVKSISDFYKAKAMRRLVTCRYNLRMIGRALAYYKSALCEYPTNLKELCPNNLIKIPLCPSAKLDTYSVSYKRDPSGDSYVLYCSGHHHKDCGLEENFPQYYHGVGIIQRQKNVPKPKATPEPVSTPADAGKK
jgi:hypothetical protein